MNPKELLEQQRMMRAYSPDTETVQGKIEAAIMISMPVTGIWQVWPKHSNSPTGSSAIEEMLFTIQAMKENQPLEPYDAANPRLMEEQASWTEAFLQAIELKKTQDRFAPVKRKGKGEQALDPALHNVLPDGWHHTPVTQPLEAMPT